MIRAYPYAVETRIEDAAGVLTHYIRQALPNADPADTHAEMRGIVESIIEAAELLADKRENERAE